MEQALDFQIKIDEIPETVPGTSRNFKNEVFSLADRFGWDYAIWQAAQLAEVYRLNAVPEPPPPPPPTRNTARPAGRSPKLPAMIEAAYLNGEITLEKAQQLAEELKRVPENIGTEAEMYRPSRTVGEAIRRTNRAIMRSQAARLGLRPNRALGGQDHARDLRLADERRRIEENLARRRTPEFIEYCRTHPNDPDCQQMDRQFKRLYGEAPPPAAPPRRPAPPPVEMQLVPPPPKNNVDPPVAFEPPPVAVPMPPPQRDPGQELADRIGGDANWKEFFDKLDDAGRKRLTLTWCQAHPEYEPCWKLYGKQLGGDFDLGDNTFKFLPGDRLKLLKEWCRTRPNHEACRERTLGAAGLN